MSDTASQWRLFSGLTPDWHQLFAQSPTTTSSSGGSCFDGLLATPDVPPAAYPFMQHSDSVQYDSAPFGQSQTQTFGPSTNYPFTYHGFQQQTRDHVQHQTQPGFQFSQSLPHYSSNSTAHSLFARGGGLFLKDAPTTTMYYSQLDDERRMQSLHQRGFAPSSPEQPDFQTMFSRLSIRADDSRPTFGANSMQYQPCGYQIPNGRPSSANNMQAPQQHRQPNVSCVKPAGIDATASKSAPPCIRRRINFDSAPPINGAATWPGYAPPGTPMPSIAAIFAAQLEDELEHNAVPDFMSTSHHSTSSARFSAMAAGAQPKVPGIQVNGSPVPAGKDNNEPSDSILALRSAGSTSAPVLGRSDRRSALDTFVNPNFNGHRVSQCSQSSRHKNNVKAFLKELHSKAKDGLAAAKAFVFDLPNPMVKIANLPYEVQAQICLELADLAKRESEFAQAREFYLAAATLCRKDTKPWFEFAKMEEENGNLQAAAAILEEGMKYCDDLTGDKSGAESLLFRALRICSRTGDVATARKLLGRVLNIIKSQKSEATQPDGSTMDQVVDDPMDDEDYYKHSKRKSEPNSPNRPPRPRHHRRMNSDEGIPEGDEYESRTSQHQNSSLPWRIILEGAILEWKFGRPALAHSILDYLQREMPYRTQPYLCAADLLKKEGRYVDAYHRILTGLEYLPFAGQLYFEALHLQQHLLRIANSDNPDIANQIRRDFMTPEDYFNNYLPKFITKAVNNLSPELIWKFYCEVAHLFERNNDVVNARRALVNSERHAPQNLYWKIWLHGARVELSCGEPSNARKLLVRSMLLVPKKMQSLVLLDISRFEEVLGNVKKARYIIQKAKLDTDFEWKVLLEAVLLEMRAGNIDRAISEARSALQTHSSTGRLWAVLIQLEHLRSYLCPNSDPDGTTAYKVFEEALHEVPKSGEVWCEGARLALHRGDYARARQFLDFSLHFTPQYGDSLIEYLRLALLEGEPQADLMKLHQVCASAEPDYGPVWAFCKQSPLDTGLHNLFVNARSILLSLRAHDPTMDIARYQALMPFHSLPLADKIRVAFG